MMALVNAYAERGLLLPRTEASLRSRLPDFIVAVEGGEVVGCGALTALSPGVGEVRTLAVREDQSGRGIGRAVVQRLLEIAGEREFAEVLALTRRVSFFSGLGFEVTKRERFEEKLAADCQACPFNSNCDETAMVRLPARAATAVAESHGVKTLSKGAA
jgi:amino-acid N-acetyltransferase